MDYLKETENLRNKILNKIYLLVEKAE